MFHFCSPAVKGLIIVQSENSIVIKSIHCKIPVVSDWQQYLAWCTKPRIDDFLPFLKFLCCQLVKGITTPSGSCYVMMTKGMVKVTRGFIPRKIQQHIHTGWWSLVNWWRKVLMRHYIRGSWILMRMAVGLMDGTALTVISVSNVIPRQQCQPNAGLLYSLDRCLAVWTHH